jgi:hypothetical protein
MKITAYNRLGVLRLRHDPEARMIQGTGAALCRAYIDRWPGHGLLYGGTQPAVAPDPLGSTRDLAVMLATFGWQLDRETSALLPKPTGIPEGAVA